MCMISYLATDNFLSIPSSYVNNVAKYKEVFNKVFINTLQLSIGISISIYAHMYTHSNVLFRNTPNMFM